MPRVSKKSVEPAVAPAPMAEPAVKKAGVRFGKMTEEHKAKLAEHKDASKQFKASLRGNLMVGKTYEQALERATAHEAKVKAKAAEAK